MSDSKKPSQFELRRPTVVKQMLSNGRILRRQGMILKEAQLKALRLVKEAAEREAKFARPRQSVATNNSVWRSRHVGTLQFSSILI
jgi:hypothetical protein